MNPRLEHLWLMSADLECEHRERIDEALAVELDLDDLAFDDLGGGTVAVRVGFDVSLETRAQDGAYASATFRLIYRMQPLVDLAERRRFAVERALPDAWPAWRAWLNSTLAAMGLPPDPLPAGLPAKLLREGIEAFDLTLQVERQLADEAEKAKA